MVVANFSPPSQDFLISYGLFLNDMSILKKQDKCINDFELIILYLNYMVNPRVELSMYRIGGNEG
ncbi:hypothetical protein CD798_13235 [Bacillaceae bacterium SAOS 7]|nr:hypothetical protein CD798_13235 [Bacillaceae bacterium SAOS 7]